MDACFLTWRCVVVQNFESSIEVRVQKQRVLGELQSLFHFEKWQKIFDYRIIYTRYNRPVERKFSKKLEETGL